jgi:hypothetical protein
MPPVTIGEVFTINHFSETSRTCFYENMNLGFSGRSVILATILLGFGAFAVNHSRAAELTGVFVFSCDEDGNPAGDFVWDTRGLDSDFYKVWLALVEPGHGHETIGQFVHGPTWAEAPLSFPLEKGQNRFALFFQNNGPWTHFGINLFFDGSLVPQISAKVPLHSNRGVPRFSANTAAATFSMTSYPQADAPAAGVTRVRLDQTITLQSFSVTSPDSPAVDLVGTHAAGPNGRSDYVGTLTLKVSGN